MTLAPASSSPAAPPPVPPGRRGRPTGRHGLLRRALPVIGVAAAAALAAATAASLAVNAATAGTLPPPPLGPDSHYVQTGDVLTHYEQWGTRGSPVVLVHGFVESTHVWHPVAARLAERHRVYAIDVRGYGYTQRRGPYTLDGDVDQLAAFLTALHLDAAHGARPLLVGHSMGAAIVGATALRMPDQVAGVVFLDGDGTPNGGPPDWVRHLFVEPYQTTLIRLGLRASWAIDRAYAAMCGPGCPPMTPPERDAWTRPFRVPGAEAALKEIMHSPLVGLPDSQLRRIRVPAAVVAGADSPLMSPALTRLTAQRLHATLVVSVPGARHLLLVSHPAEVAAAIERMA